MSPAPFPPTVYPPPPPPLLTWFDGVLDIGEEEPSQGISQELQICHLELCEGIVATVMIAVFGVASEGKRIPSPPSVFKKITWFGENAKGVARPLVSFARADPTVPEEKRN